MGGKKFRKETDKNMSAGSKKNLCDSVKKYRYFLELRQSNSQNPIHNQQK